MAAKSSDEYRNFQSIDYAGANEKYLSKGYVANYGVIAKDKQPDNGEFIIKTISDECANQTWLNDLNRIVDYCENKEIELVLFISPQPFWSLEKAVNYQEYNDYIQIIADENGLLFYDFNLCRKELFDSNDANLFYDNDHMNYDGGVIFSGLLADIINKEITGDNLLYSSWKGRVNAK